MDAASSVFARHGYERATLSDVAAAAGLTKGAVYSSFASKEELLFELMKERIAQRLALVEEATHSTENLTDLTADIGSSLLDLLTTQRDWQLLFIEFWSQAVRNPQLRAEFAEHRQRTRELVGRIIELVATDAGAELPMPPEDLAVIVLGLANGVALEQIADPDTVDPDTVTQALHLLIRGLIASSGSPDAMPTTSTGKT
jgi:AcrR family transcriptional regulator